MSFPPWDAPEDSLGCQRPDPVVVEPERKQAPEVQCRDADIEPCIVTLDSAIAKASVVLGDEPGDRALGHRPVLAIDRFELRVSPSGSGCDELGVVGPDAELVATKASRDRRYVTLWAL